LFAPEYLVVNTGITISSRWTTYTFFLGQTADRRLIEVRRSVYGGHVCVLDERLADDIHGEPLAALHVRDCVFEAARAEVVAGEGNDGWGVGDLLVEH